MSTPSLRHTVPVLGTGFNRWLLGGTGASPAMLGWWDLLKKMASRGGLASADPGLDEALRGHGEPTFAWERLVHAHQTVHGGKDTTHQHERQLLRDMSDVLEVEAERLAKKAEVQQRAQQFAAALGAVKGGALRCDVLTLNFDRTLQKALAATPAADGTPEQARWPLGLEPGHDVVAGSGWGPLHFWYPHGDASRPDSMVAGALRYARSTERVLKNFDSFRETVRTVPNVGAPPDEQSPFASRLKLRGGPDDPKLSWLAVAIDAPLLLLGVGLSRSESDLWAFLHLRARNHARLAPPDRPPIYRLTCRDERPEDRAHWKSVPPSIRIEDLNLGNTWGDAWTALLDTLTVPSRRFP
jgi:hypothetical protein